MNERKRRSIYEPFFLSMRFEKNSNPFFAWFLLLSENHPDPLSDSLQLAFDHETLCACTSLSLPVLPSGLLFLSPSHSRCARNG